MRTAERWEVKALERGLDWGEDWPDTPPAARSKKMYLAIAVN